MRNRPLRACIGLGALCWRWTRGANCPLDLSTTGFSNLVGTTIRTVLLAVCGDCFTDVREGDSTRDILPDLVSEAVDDRGVAAFGALRCGAFMRCSPLGNFAWGAVLGVVDRKAAGGAALGVVERKAAGGVVDRLLVTLGLGAGDGLADRVCIKLCLRLVRDVDEAARGPIVARKPGLDFELPPFAESTLLSLLGGVAQPGKVCKVGGLGLSKEEVDPVTPDNVLGGRVEE